jgi:hypothetical protein
MSNLACSDVLTFFTSSYRNYSNHKTNNVHIAHIRRNSNFGVCTTHKAYWIFVQYTYKHEEDVWGAIQIFFNTFNNTMSKNL